jgi:hypothetical protein
LWVDSWEVVMGCMTFVYYDSWEVVMGCMTFVDYDSLGGRNGELRH